MAKVAYERRSNSDPMWAKTKATVDQRDRKQCRFLKCISISEAKMMKYGSEKTIDRAHIFSAGNYPDQIYNSNNIVSLTRFIHRRMDNYQNPLTGENISDEEHWYWWWRIKNRKICKYNPEIDYKLLLMQELKMIKN